MVIGRGVVKLCHGVVVDVPNKRAFSSPADMMGRLDQPTDLDRRIRLIWKRTRPLRSSVRRSTGNMVLVR